MPLPIYCRFVHGICFIMKSQHLHMHQCCCTSGKTPCYWWQSLHAHHDRARAKNHTSLYKNVSYKTSSGFKHLHLAHRPHGPQNAELYCSSSEYSQPASGPFTPDTVIPIHFHFPCKAGRSRILSCLLHMCLMHDLFNPVAFLPPTAPCATQISPFL